MKISTYEKAKDLISKIGELKNISREFESQKKGRSHELRLTNYNDTVFIDNVDPSGDLRIAITELIEAKISKRAAALAKELEELQDDNSES